MYRLPLTKEHFSPVFILITHQSFSGEHLQEFEQHLAVSHVHVEVPDTVAHADQVRVHPFLESLLLYTLSFVWKYNNIVL